MRAASPDVPKDVVDVEAAGKRTPPEEHPHWKRFDVLPSAPPDHAFYGTPPAQPSRSFLARLSKEYRVLSSSLPGTFPPPVAHLSFFFGRGGAGTNDRTVF